MTEWNPNSFEDKLLNAYHREVGGHIYTEVSAPHRKGNKDWPEGYRNRYVDAIRIIDSDFEEKIVPFSNHGDEFVEMAEGSSLELIEIKRRLNRPVIGQVIAAKDLVEVEYLPEEVRKTVLCNGADPALEWVCEERNIAVELIEPLK